MYFNSEIKNVLAASPFREVYLLTRIDTKTKVYVPLKLILFLSEVYMFRKVLETYNPAYDEAEEIFIYHLAEYLLTKGLQDIYMRPFGENFEIIYSSYGIIFTPESIKVHDYNDYEMPTNMKKIEKSNLIPFVIGELLEIDKKVSSSYTFRTEIAYEANHVNYEEL
ncbi:hypothetical protein [Parageobacillus thermoglucosidasius]|uniref:Uncharacterized protein n=1 Tax=Parageobacillus thermoglucosidasius TaxID=1426 RepID=A0AB38R1L9_PARTM|nr:hypothetical protein [Parageobacillus thermoglucosidasius]UOE77599.1 hypothetical protein IMI45_07275 [Parageobacillus thermoglucosidasius]